MTFRHSMTVLTQGIQVEKPVSWRSLEGMIGVYWQASGRIGANAYYISQDPRIVIFFNDVADHIRLSNQSRSAREWRPMARGIYVPAGVPMWTSFTGAHIFSHVDIHIHKDRLMRFLSPSLGESLALSAVRTPVELHDSAAIDTLAQLVAQQLSNQSKHDIFIENLVGSIVAGLLEIPADDETSDASGGLTQRQMKRLNAYLDENRDRRLSVAELARTAGLSESWFANVFKKTTGKTPHQWQTERRIKHAQKLLADSDLRVAQIATQLGFSDQAHLTKVFRQSIGETPAAWRRKNHWD